MSRPLTPGEQALARSVFGEAIDYDRVRISTRRWGWAAICFWSHITFPPSHPAPRDIAFQGWRDRALLIHELTHVWQFQTSSIRTLMSWAGVLLSGGYGAGARGYRYPLPPKPWAACNLEQQASMVEHAYLLRETGRCAAAPPGAALSDYAGATPFF